ncbi:MAG: Cys-tRNA(Pro) deacylase [Christensenellaceae bacterium]|jgi:Cys-tRNA(Pro)/Cys-tRNA(Cys) deacylase|nr:Cys-tRNA(Pro) deacylase [Christensenellaceae bacterium]
MGTKTNAMRLLEQAGLDYEALEYEVDEEDLSGLSTAQKLGVAPESLFKTLVAKGEKRGYAVFCIPCGAELDLKKAARALGDKSVEMLPVKDLKAVTGYLRGGCSPIGMKKDFPSFFDESAILFQRVFLSAGARGAMLRLAPEPLAALLNAPFCDLTKE